MKKKALLIMLSLMVGSTCLVGCNNNSKPEEKPAVTEEKVSFDWSKQEFIKEVPLPDTDKTSIEEDDEDEFWVYINGDKEAFKAYVEKCKEAGFTIDADEWKDESYDAYNEKGTEISLSLDGTQYELSVKPSKARGSLTWPTAGVAAMLPTPESKVGSITIDSSKQFVAFVGEMDREKFKAYMDECVAKGFNCEYDKGDDYFNGKNQNGDKLHLEYKETGEMNILLHCEGAIEEETSSEETQTGDTGDVNPDFKATMDSYEAMINEYVEFMKKYEESSDPVSMMNDLNEYMTKYTETMTKLSEIDSSTLSEADAAYYLEVYGRITTKITEL